MKKLIDQSKKLSLSDNIVVTEASIVQIERAVFYNLTPLNAFSLLR